MRDRFRPDVPGENKTQATAARMGDLARGLKSALMCRDVKNLINSKPAKRAFDYEKKIEFPERWKLKTLSKPKAKVKA
jgi:hypothetical protein